MPEQIAIDFAAEAPRSYTDTRSHRNDPATSRDAAKNAASTKAQDERIAIRQALTAKGDMTAREIAEATGIDYIEVQRRMSETAGIERTDARRDGCAVWSVASTSVDDGVGYFAAQGERDRQRMEGSPR